MSLGRHSSHTHTHPAVGLSHPTVITGGHRVLGDLPQPSSRLHSDPPSAAIGLFASMAAVFLGGARASGLLFRSLLWDVARSPIGFFESTPVGRLLNRFSKETDTVDVDIPDKLRSLLTYAFGLLEVGLAVSMATPLAIVAILPLVLLYAGFQVWRGQSPGRAEVSSVSPLPLGKAWWERVCMERGGGARSPAPPCRTHSRPCLLSVTP